MPYVDGVDGHFLKIYIYTYRSHTLLLLIWLPEPKNLQELVSHFLYFHLKCSSLGMIKDSKIENQERVSLLFSFIWFPNIDPCHLPCSIPSLLFETLSPNSNPRSKSSLLYHWTKCQKGEVEERQQKERGKGNVTLKFEKQSNLN